MQDTSGLGDAGFSYATNGGPPRTGVYFLKGSYQVEVVLDGGPAGSGADSTADAGLDAAGRSLPSVQWGDGPAGDPRN